MIRHGITPEGMSTGTIVPIPKGRWANLASSSNYRAITISSLLGKVIDLIILEKESDNLCTNESQFSYKEGLSTTLCTAMVKETVSYFIYNQDNI